MKKIALEEHFITQDFLTSTQKSDFIAMDQKGAAKFQKRLLDLHDLRVVEMDKAGLFMCDAFVHSVFKSDVASQLVQKASLNDSLKEKICFKNAERILKL